MALGGSFRATPARWDNEECRRLLFSLDYLYHRDGGMTKDEYAFVRESEGLYVLDTTTQSIVKVDGERLKSVLWPHREFRL